MEQLSEHEYTPSLDHSLCDHESYEAAACELDSAIAELESIDFVPIDGNGEIREQLKMLARAWRYLTHG